ncbi:MAG: threonine/serine dehydratase [Phycisphaerales bacterium]|nr:threonine/serine dehydratase [Phycisphaerales bacterium]
MALSRQVEAADERLRDRVVETPLVPSPHLGDGVSLKLENRQHSGSFKARGALNRLLHLDPETAARGVIAASTGNHALAMAWAGAQASIDDIMIFAPRSITPAKRAKLEAKGVQVQIHGDDCMEAETEARRVAEQSGRCYVSPYNDPLVVAGQGTVGAELLRQADTLDAVLIAVGGGGLIAGTGAILKAHHPGIEIIGCLPRQSPAMLECLRAGEIIDVVSGPTLSDGTAGGVEPGAITFDWCRELVDDWIVVDEPDIAEAMEMIHAHHDMQIEGAAGVAVAAWNQAGDRWTGKRVAIVICGGNVASPVGA